MEAGLSGLLSYIQSPPLYGPSDLLLAALTGSFAHCVTSLRIQGRIAVFAGSLSAVVVDRIRSIGRFGTVAVHCVPLGAFEIVSVRSAIRVKHPLIPSPVVLRSPSLSRRNPFRHFFSPHLWAVGEDPLKFWFLLLYSWYGVEYNR